MIIYSITNLINNKKYIGQTIQSLDERIRQHFKPSAKSCPALASAIKKYGRNNFVIEQIATADCIDALNALEVEMIKKYNTLSPLGYNLEEGGLNGKDSQETILKRKKSLNTKEVKLKIAVASSNNWKDPIYRANMEKHLKDRWLDPQYKAKMLEKRRTPEHRARSKQLITKCHEAKKRAVISIEISTGVCTEYPSIKDACLKGFQQAGISKCIKHEKGRYKHKGHWFVAKS